MTKEDEDAIREIELRFNEAWGRHDPDGMVESLSDDAQFVTVNGAWAETRAEMHVCFLAPDVAMMHTRFHIYGDIDESERTSIGIRVVRKLDGRWRTVAVHNTDVRAGRRH
jgi:ketosteroid isomerase-like protein